MIDIPVLIVFFCRPEKLRMVFDSVRRARPSKLYLYQDGPREGREDDRAGIFECRDIVDEKNIDWPCEVKRFYQKHNMGCDPSGYLAQKWLFDNEEMGIILEDDSIPSQSFYIFCKELLEYYKDDERINMICGMNNIDIANNIKESYFFIKRTPIWGWASWRRVFKTWDAAYSWLDDKEKLEIVKAQTSKERFETFVNTAKKHRDSGIIYYETLIAASMYLNDRVSIIPQKNMIKNIGIGTETTHSVDDIRILPRKTQRLFYKKTYDLDFPLRHPTDIKDNKKLEKKIARATYLNLFDKIEYFFRILYYRGLKRAVYKLIRSSL